MKKNFKIGLVVVLALTIIGLGAYYQLNKPTESKQSQQQPQGEIGTDINDIAPDFELTNLEGEEVSLSDYRGQYVILNFWATWCPPCREEIPDLNQFHEENKKEFVVLAVNLGEAKQKVRQFISYGGYTFPVLLDKGKEIGREYKISAIPTSYFINPQGKIKYIKKGAVSKTELDKIKQDLQK